MGFEGGRREGGGEGEKEEEEGERGKRETEERKSWRGVHPFPFVPLSSCLITPSSFIISQL